MLVTDEAEIAGILACPACRSPISTNQAPSSPSWRCGRVGCSLHDRVFDRVRNKSVLVDFERSVLDRHTVLDSGGASAVSRHGVVRRLARQLAYGSNRVAPHFAARMIAEVPARAVGDDRRPLVLVVGGGTIGNGAEELYRSDAVDVVSLDIYWSESVTFLADGHAIPLAEASVDGVWIQAVLEHVADPATVVAEIHRVLRPGGVVFADTPFLWPVHEGAYDFTRWTPSGHRWLFRDFEALASGTSSGPGTLLVLALRYLAASLARSTKVGHLVALPFFWVRFLDRLCDARGGLDAAAGLFFFGRRSDTPITPHELVRFYDEQVPLQRQVRSIEKAARRRSPSLG